MTGSEIAILAVLLGLIPAAVAQRKGESFLGFWLFGALLFVIALPVALIMKRRPGRGEQWCPQCRAIVPAEALVCQHCQHRFVDDVPDVPTDEPADLPPRGDVAREVLAAGWVAVALGLASLGYAAWVMAAG